MTNKEFVLKLIDIADNYKTLYVMGGFGGPLNDSNKKYYIDNYAYNAKATTASKIKKASNDTFAFDCVCLVKGVLWGWNGDTTKQWGGAVYQSNGVPDIGTKQMIEVCQDVSTDFTNIEIGELVYMPGHVGVYIGNGRCVESTPAWDGDVQYSNLGNLSQYKTGRYRVWTSHGKLPYLDYIKEESLGEIKMFDKNKEIYIEHNGVEYTLKINYNDKLENSATLIVSKRISTNTNGVSGNTRWASVLDKGAIKYFTVSNDNKIIEFGFEKIYGTTHGARWYKSNAIDYPGAVTTKNIQAWYISRGTNTLVDGICTINIDGTLDANTLQKLI